MKLTTFKWLYAVFCLFVAIYTVWHVFQTKHYTDIAFAILAVVSGVVVLRIKI